MATAPAPIIRQGELGNYSYFIHAGDEEKPLFSVSLDSIRRYANWKANKDILSHENEMMTEQGVYDFQEDQLFAIHAAVTEPFSMGIPYYQRLARTSKLDEKLSSNHVVVLLESSNQSDDSSSGLVVLSFFGSMFFGAECYRYYNRSLENRRLENRRLENVGYEQMLVRKKEALEKSEEAFFKKQSEAMRAGNSSQDLLLLNELAERAKAARKIAEEIGKHQKSSSKAQTNDRDAQHSYEEYLSWTEREECWVRQRNTVLQQELLPLTGHSCKKFPNFSRVMEELRTISSSATPFDDDALIESREEIKKDKTLCQREINEINKMPELTAEEIKKKISSFERCSEKIEKLRGKTLLLIYKKKLFQYSEARRQELTGRFLLLKEEDAWSEGWRAVVEKFYQQQELFLEKVKNMLRTPKSVRRQTF